MTACLQRRRYSIVNELAQDHREGCTSDSRAGQDQLTDAVEVFVVACDGPTDLLIPAVARP
jgi:hypothetical protein